MQCSRAQASVSTTLPKVLSLAFFFSAAARACRCLSSAAGACTRSHRFDHFSLQCHIPKYTILTINLYLRAFDDVNGIKRRNRSADSKADTPPSCVFVAKKQLLQIVYTNNTVFLLAK